MFIDKSCFYNSRKFAARHTSPQSARPSMDASFLTDRFTVFGLEFQNWMVIVAVGLVLYAVYLSLRQRNGSPR